MKNKKQNPITITIDESLSTSVFTLKTPYKRTIKWNESLYNGTYGNGKFICPPNIKNGKNENLIDTIHLSNTNFCIEPKIRENLAVFNQVGKGATIYYPEIEVCTYKSKQALMIGHFNASNRHKNQVLITNLQDIVRTGELIANDYLCKWLIGNNGFKVWQIAKLLKISGITIINFQNDIETIIGNINEQVNCGIIQPPNID